MWDRWGQHRNSNSSHRVVVPCPPDVHVEPSVFLLEVAVLQGDVPGGRQQLQPHLDGIAPHGEALARQAQASWKQISHNSTVRAVSCSQLSASAAADRAVTVPPILGLSHPPAQPACPPGRCAGKYPCSRSSRSSFQAVWHPEPTNSSRGWRQIPTHLPVGRRNQSFSRVTAGPQPRP